MKLIDLDQRVIVPVVDETRGGMRYEREMSLGELLGKALENFEPEIVEAVPMWWLQEKMRQADDAGDLDSVDLFSWIIQTWQKDQEART